MASIPWSPTDTRDGADRFYHRMAWSCLAIAVLDFTPSYFVPLVSGHGSWPPIFHVHGWLFFGWVLFFWWQNRLIVTGQPQRHRAWGLVGIALGTSMVWAGLALVSVRIATQHAAGFVVEGRSFAWIGVSDLLIFAGLLAFAIAKVRSPETHKRLMLMATISLLGPPIGRWVLLAISAFTTIHAAPGAPPPVTAGYVPHLLSFTLVAVAMARDLRTIGRVHPAYLASFAPMVLQLVTLTTVASSRAWHWIAGGMAAMGG